MKFSKVFKVTAADLLIIICFCLVCFAMVHALDEPEIIGYTEYIVRSGDTLWEIVAQSNGYDKLDTRKIIDDIEEKSDCNAYIYPGQLIYIPVYDI